MTSLSDINVKLQVALRNVAMAYFKVISLSYSPETFFLSGGPYRLLLRNLIQCCMIFFFHGHHGDIAVVKVAVKLSKPHTLITTLCCVVCVCWAVRYHCICNLWEPIMG